MSSNSRTGHSVYKILSIAATLPLLSHVNAEETRSDNDSEDIENIVVYAQKRAQDMRDIAVTVSAFDGKFLESRHLKDTTQLSSLVPNFKITTNAAEGSPPAFNIRGVGMMDYNSSSISPIAVYIDEVVSGSANNLSSNLFDIEQVEVLRGPQGTLFGRNTTGGAVLVQSVMPSDEQRGYVRGSLAEQDHSSFSAAGNILMSDKLSSRLAVNYENYDYSTNNLFPGVPQAGMKQTALRWITKYEHDGLDVTFKLQKDQWDGLTKPVESVGVMDLATGTLCPPEQVGAPNCTDSFGFRVDSDDFWDTNSDQGDKRHESDKVSASLKVQWDVSEQITLTSITAKADLDRYHAWDSDGPGNFIEGDFGTDNELFSQELNIAYSNKDIYWITGLFYINEDIALENSIDLFRDFRVIPGLEAVGAQFFYHNRIENKSTALYSQVDYDLSAQLTLTAGLRFTDESTDYQTIGDLDTVAGVIPEFWNISGAVDDNEMSGKLSLVHKISDSTTMYYSYARGYKSGGYNAGYTTSPQEAADSEYRPETVDSFEIGSRLSLWENKMRANFSAFYYDYKDQQVFINFVDQVSPYDALKNAGDSTIYGLESEMWFDFSDAVTANFNVGYIPEAEIGNFNDGEIFVVEARMPFTSKWNVSGSVFYENDISDGILSAELGFDFQSSFFFDQREDPYTEQESFMKWNARVAYEFDNNIEVGLWGKNLFNEESTDLRFNTIAALSAITELKAEKRQLGVDIIYSF